VAAQVRKRLYWEFGNLTMSGVTGITGASETVSDPAVERVSRDAVMAIDPEPHGIMGVDVAFDDKGRPKVTEINSGRFMSGGVILFASHGFNFPYVAAKAGLGEKINGAGNMISPFPEGMICIRGLDVEPVITTRQRMEAPVSEMERRLARLKKG
jgi:carbamoyl-phosphate synthase large subunit